MTVRDTAPPAELTRTGVRWNTSVMTYTTAYTLTTDRHAFITADKPGTVTHRFRGQAHLHEHGSWYAVCGRIVPGFVDDERETARPVCSACAKRLGK